jgi:phage gp36-like protein
MSGPFALPADIEYRYPREAHVLAADERTRTIDWDRVEAALSDVSTEIRAILQARYTPVQIDDLDESSLGVLRLFAIDMALYRVSLSFGRQTEQIKTRYDLAVARLEGIAKGKGGLTFRSRASDATTSPGEVQISAPERQFTRGTLGSI